MGTVRCVRYNTCALGCEPGGSGRGVCVRGANHLTALPAWRGVSCPMCAARSKPPRRTRRRVAATDTCVAPHCAAGPVRQGRRHAPSGRRLWPRASTGGQRRRWWWVVARARACAASFAAADAPRRRRRGRSSRRERAGRHPHPKGVAPPPAARRLPRVAPSAARRRPRQ